MGFGEPSINWINILYTALSAIVTTNGHHIVPHCTGDQAGMPTLSLLIYYFHWKKSLVCMLMTFYSFFFKTLNHLCKKQLNSVHPIYDYRLFRKLAQMLHPPTAQHNMEYYSPYKSYSSTHKSCVSHDILRSQHFLQLIKT